MTAAMGGRPTFYETMPSRYRQLFHGAPVQEHAAIVSRRGHAPAHAEIWRPLPQGGAIVCVVAEDRAGLLSHLGTTLTTQSLDLLAAQVYARASAGGAEVVDLLWLRRDEEIASSVAEADVARVAELLGGLITGELRFDGRPLGARRASPDVATLVRFDEATPVGAPDTLLLETLERPGLFRAVIETLRNAGVRIIGSRRAIGGGGRVVHRFTIAEGDGSKPDQYRRGLVQAEVLRVVEVIAQRSGGAVVRSRLEEPPVRDDASGPAAAE